MSVKRIVASSWNNDTETISLLISDELSKRIGCLPGLGRIGILCDDSTHDSTALKAGQAAARRVAAGGMDRLQLVLPEAECPQMATRK